MTTARELSMERRYDPLTPDQAKFLRRMRDEWAERADSMPLADKGRIELLGTIGDVDGFLSVVAPEPTPLEAASRNALDAWDALNPPMRAMTGIDFLTAMEAMRIEVFR